MKTLKTLLLIVSLFVSQLVLAQNKEIDNLTTAYFGIKDALVADDAKTAGSQSELFLKSIDAVSKSNLSASQLKVWQEQKDKLIATNEAISKTTDIAKQREELNELSNSLFATLKAFNVNENTVYYQYCPMKKSYWLSSEKEIKNPYYGEKMLTCGSVKDSLK